MAAKQGLSAQISQASEDAKRAVLERTSLTKSLWFSNLNTTCTIKSAPPRTPDVLGLLAVKSGWLFKRNEQHVWQARYCCVVPHTFLYYFDVHPNQPCQTPQLTAKQQEDLNNYVRKGYGKRGQAQPRSSLYHVLGTGTSNAPPTPLPPLPDAEAGGGGDDKPPPSNGGATVQPAGIIDLECYTTIHRNSQNQLLMELAGDETVNPDLRSFYFCANTETEGEEWTQALLAERHSSLADEREAYKQVCDGFSQQLQVLHAELDQAKSQADAQQEELYRVRSQMEDQRRSCLRLVNDVLERQLPFDATAASSTAILPAKKAYKTDLETIHAQDLGIVPAVQLLCDYSRVLEETCGDTSQTIAALEGKLEQKQEVDGSKVQQMQAEIDRLKEEVAQQQTTYQGQLETLQQKYLQSQKELQDVQKDLASQRMETTMYQSSTRTKVGELQSHKKILKKEVIDLRKKLEEANSELDLYRHRASSVKMEAEQERQKSQLLERYVEKIESQVKVQQNMMEMMSQSGSVYAGGSVYGGSQFGSPPPPSPGRSLEKMRFPPGQESGYNEILMDGSRLPANDRVDDDEDDDDEDEGGNGARQAKRRGRKSVDDSDNKSHMSELTEDRTQKQFDMVMLNQITNPHLRAAIAASPRAPQQSANGPPAIIIGIDEETSERDGSRNPGPKLDTIASGTPSRRPPTSRRDARYTNGSLDDSPTRRSGMERSIDRVMAETDSVGSQSRMSVAQRARLEADRTSTPVRIRASQTPLRGNNSANRDDGSRQNSVSGKSFLANLGRRLEDAIDNSILGVEDISTDGSGYATTDVHTDVENDVQTDMEDEKKTGDTVSEASTNVSISLAERQKLQRSQQLKFLKEQGLIKNEKDVTGGAGSDARSVSSSQPSRRKPRIEKV